MMIQPYTRSLFLSFYIYIHINIHINPEISEGFPRTTSKNMAIQIADDRKTIDSDMNKFVSQKSMVSTKNKKYNW